MASLRKEKKGSLFSRSGSTWFGCPGVPVTLWPGRCVPSFSQQQFAQGTSWWPKLIQTQPRTSAGPLPAALQKWEGMETGALVGASLPGRDARREEAVRQDTHSSSWWHYGDPGVSCSSGPPLDFMSHRPVPPTVPLFFLSPVCLGSSCPQGSAG